MTESPERRRIAISAFMSMVPPKGEWILGVGVDKSFAVELAAAISRPSVIEENSLWFGQITYVVKSPGHPWRKGLPVGAAGK